MKRLSVLVLVLTFIITTIQVISQMPKLKDYIDPKNVKDYKSKVKESAIYTDEMKYIIHNFEIYNGSQLLEKGKIYREFFKNGSYESFYILGEKGLFKIAYWSDPTALITCNLRKSEYCIENDINARLFPFIIRGYAKLLKSGAVEKPFKKVNIKLSKKNTYKENKNEMTVYEVVSTPNVISGTITCMNKSLIVKGDLLIDNDNAKRSGLKGLFAQTELPSAMKLTLKFDLNYFETKKPSQFQEINLEDILKKYTKIDCD